MTGSRLFIVFAIAVAGLVGGAGTLQKGTVPRQLCMVLYYASSVYKPVCTSQRAGTARVVDHGYYRLVNDIHEWI